MKQDAPEKLRTSIAGKVRQLRTERRWTQAQLAKLLGLSQNRLSEIELGQGSFTAEQLLVVLKTFNVPVDYFASSKASAESQLQNALARLGGSHLFESSEVLPTEALKEVNEVYCRPWSAGSRQDRLRPWRLSSSRTSTGSISPS